ncbi:MAG TPA: putative hydro-lyase [Pirellulales bacterium]
MHNDVEPIDRAKLVDISAAQLRALIRAGRWTEPTAGLARGYVQANLVILPDSDADAFEEFCRLNPAPCPLLERTARGDYEPRESAPGADLRTDVSRYRIFHNGQLDALEPTDIRTSWRDDLVGFLLGCSFTFENALLAGGLPVRHIELGRNVPMYRTSRACQPAGPFQGNLVVSMRPFPAHLVEQAIAITSEYPTMHGAPIHVGDAAALGIHSLDQPDFGDPVPIHPGEVPVFWACGVTPQVALCDSKTSFAITHSPGCMFVSDWRDTDARRPSDMGGNKNASEVKT